MPKKIYMGEKCLLPKKMPKIARPQPETCDNTCKLNRATELSAQMVFLVRLFAPKI